MSEAQHTPAPWSHTGLDDHCDTGRRYHEIIDSHGFEVINQNGILWGTDAPLIAAAPCLLDALVNLINCHTGASWQTPEVQREAWIAARAAITKATEPATTTLPKPVTATEPR